VPLVAPELITIIIICDKEGARPLSFCNWLTADQKKKYSNQYLIGLYHEFEIVLPQDLNIKTCKQSLVETLNRTQ
jgi:hypothetical protein